MKRWLPDFLVICAILLVVGYGFAQSWTETLSVVSPFNSVTLSANGQHAIAVPTGNSGFISTNAGNTWRPVTFSVGVSRVAASAVGKNMVGIFDAGGIGYVNVSTNSGNTWVPTRSPYGIWTACACSADGAKLVAALKNGSIYTSTNFGTTWLTNNVPAKWWSCLASSADGTKLFAGALGELYGSTNAGVTWAAAAGLPINAEWYSIALSADGNHVLATGLTGAFISSDAGGNWTPCNLIGVSGASSADGSKLIICNGQVYTSTNFGINWVTNQVTSAVFSGCASSADGNGLLAISGGSVWTYQTIPSPQLGITQSKSNLVISWLIPSTNLFIQQSPDLLSWSSITDQPALNLTNLNYELNITPSNASSFFQLVSQIIK